jgi:cytidine deaminase
MSECYYNKFAIAPQCQNEAVFKGANLHNVVDGWTWCAEHSPPMEYRQALAFAAVEGNFTALVATVDVR